LTTRHLRGFTCARSEVIQNERRITAATVQPTMQFTHIEIIHSTTLAVNITPAHIWKDPLPEVPAGFTNAHLPRVCIETRATWRPCLTAKQRRRRWGNNSLHYERDCRRKWQRSSRRPLEKKLSSTRNFSQMTCLPPL
ncbi:hypothetical protein M514_11143, partial [Trichuris suis]